MGQCWPVGQGSMEAGEDSVAGSKHVPKSEEGEGSFKFSQVNMGQLPTAVARASTDKIGGLGSSLAL